MLNHFQDMIDVKSAATAVFEMRKHFGWYIKGLPRCAKFRDELFKLNNVAEIKSCVINYFKSLQNNELS